MPRRVRIASNAGRVLTMTSSLWLLPMLLWAASCGSDDEKSDSEKLCEQGTSKATECGVGIPGMCDSNCLVQCVLDAQCEEIRGTPANPFYVCQASCKGISDPFFCKNGRQFLPRSEV